MNAYEWADFLDKSTMSKVYEVNNQTTARLRQQQDEIDRLREFESNVIEMLYGKAQEK